MACSFPNIYIGNKLFWFSAKEQHFVETKTFDSHKKQIKTKDDGCKTSYVNPKPSCLSKYECQDLFIPTISFEKTANKLFRSSVKRRRFSERLACDDDSGRRDKRLKQIESNDTQNLVDFQEESLPSSSWESTVRRAWSSFSSNWNPREETCFRKFVQACLSADQSSSIVNSVPRAERLDCLATTTAATTNDKPVKLNEIGAKEMSR